MELNLKQEAFIDGLMNDYSVSLCYNTGEAIVSNLKKSELVILCGKKL